MIEVHRGVTQKLLDGLRPGDRLYADMEFSDYHDLSAISSGALRTFAKDGPLMYYACYVERSVQHKDSDAKRIGRAFHKMMECPGTWDQHYAVIPSTLEDDECLHAVRVLWPTKGNLSPGTPIVTGGKGWSQAHRDYVDLKRSVAEESGKEWVTARELENQKRMVESVFANPAIAEYLERPARAEVACIMRDEKTGLLCKALADVLPHEAYQPILDFKSTRVMNANQFSDEVFRKRGYHYQAEWYTRLMERDAFVIVAVRNEPPYEAMCYRLSRADLLDANHPKLKWVVTGGNRSVADCNSDALERIKAAHEIDCWSTPLWGGEVDLAEPNRYPQ